MRAMTKEMTWYGRKGRTVRGESPVERSRGEIWRQSRVQEWGGEEGHPGRTTAAELVLRGGGGERRRVCLRAWEEIWPSQRQGRGGGCRGWVQSFWQAPHSHQRFHLYPRNMGRGGGWHVQSCFERSLWLKYGDRVKDLTRHRETGWEAMQ